jgi:hypothetical protein
MHKDFFSLYIDYIGESEAPTFYHRWAAIMSIAGFLGRNFYFQHGHFKIYPNMYVKLIGIPATRKSTVIKIMRNLMKASGYTTFAPDKTSKEKYLMDLAGIGNEFDIKDKSPEDILTQNIFGPDISNEPVESFIAADEFNDFFGTTAILEFLSTLGNLWDYEGTYENKLKNSRQVYINNPTINIFGGNTPTNLSTLMPPEAIGQGFFSRLILVHGEPTGRRITFPKPPSTELGQQLTNFYKDIQHKVRGEAKLSKGAEDLLDKIYKTFQGIPDSRFQYYNGRRLNQLIKLTLISAASRLSTTIEVEDVIYANTVLTHTEKMMPKALGEFGKAKNSDVSHKIMQVLDSARAPMTPKDIWKQVHTDLESFPELVKILNNLLVADKIQACNGGYLNKKVLVMDCPKGTVDYNLLTDEERDMYE